MVYLGERLIIVMFFYRFLVLLLLSRGINQKHVGSHSHNKKSEAITPTYPQNSHLRTPRGDLFWSSINREYFQELRYPNFTGKEQSEGRIEFSDVCTKDMKTLIKRSIVDLQCKPVPTLVKLRSPGPNVYLLPDVAKVNRCSGFCRHKPHSCVSTKMSVIKVPVYQIDKMDFSGSSVCADVILEQHDECRCECVIMSKHCTNHQFYDREKCACVCLDFEKRDMCRDLSENNKRRYWDHNSCSCKCVPKECPGTLSWSAEMCRCVMPAAEEMSKEEMLNAL